MNSSEFYAEMINIQKATGVNSAKALEDGFKLLSEKIEKIVIPQNQESSKPSQGSKGNTYITIQSQYYDYYWSWYWQWWSHYYYHWYWQQYGHYYK